MIAPLAIAHAYLLAVGQATAQTELTLAQRAVRPLFPPSETGPLSGSSGQRCAGGASASLAGQAGSTRQTKNEGDKR